MVRWFLPSILSLIWWCRVDPFSISNLPGFFCSWERWFVPMMMTHSLSQRPCYGQLSARMEGIFSPTVEKVRNPAWCLVVVEQSIQYWSELTIKLKPPTYHCQCCIRLAGSGCSFQIRSSLHKIVGHASCLRIWSSRSTPTTLKCCSWGPEV